MWSDPVGVDALYDGCRVSVQWPVLGRTELLG